MAILFLIICLIVAILVFFMFLIFKKTVNIVNSQTKSYFVNKLQGYDDLINEKENKLNEINEQIKSKEAGIKEEKKNKEDKAYSFDYDVIDLLSKTEYRDKKLLELNKKIDENFIVNYDDLVKDFIKYAKDNNDYDFCINLRKKFNSKVIYDIKTNIDKDEAYKKVLNNDEYKVYDVFKSINNDNSVENFIDYLDQLVEINDPKIKIFVGNKKENYDHLNKNIKTVFDDKIYRGIRIMYKNKVYDFSLSERDV